MKVSFRTFKISWNTYFLNYLCWTWFHGRHLVGSSIVLFSKSLTLPDVYAFILSKCWSSSWASQELVWPFTPRLLTNAPKASCIMCAMHGMWFFNASYSIPEASIVDCSSSVTEWFEDALSVVMSSKQPLVSSKQSSRSINCTVSQAPVCSRLTDDP